MKRSFLPLLFSFLLVNAGAQNFKITLNTPGYTSGIAYLTYYSGKNFNIEDSAAVNNKSIAIFQGKRRLPGGIYSIFVPGKTKYVDLFIDKDQQAITVKIDTTDLLNKTVITGSKENIQFQEYQKYVAGKGKAWEQERQAYNISKTKQDSALHEANYNRLNKELNDYRDNIMKNQPNSMLASILSAMKDPSILHSNPKTHTDSLENYYHYRKHYWDGVTFMDERIIRSPFFLPKFEKYYREIIIQHPDTIIKEMDYQLLLARSSQEMYKFILNWATDEYINPKYMGLDAVFVHLFEKYHSKGLTGWLNEKQNETISRRAYMVMANLVGAKAADLEMLDTAGKPSSLYDLKADYTVVIFWDPNCGHCKEEVPRLDSFYKASWKQKGVKVYGVLSGDAKEDVKPAWIKFIKDHQLNEWANVYQTKAMEDADAAAQKPSYRQLYDVIMTPTLFLLDKDKQIIGKKLNLNQIDELLEVKINSTKTK
ncbi:MAG: redoxin domain-containing protein [Chitinophagaceae bacterium]|nr:redoxin domain-containing protein [Chitinophagaceae bacterium]